LGQDLLIQQIGKALFAVGFNTQELAHSLRGGGSAAGSFMSGSGLADAFSGPYGWEEVLTEAPALTLRLVHLALTNKQIGGLYVRRTTGLIVILAFCLSGCQKNGKNNSEREAFVNIPQTEGAIGSIDIPSTDFFWMIQPWKEGKLATVDGWGRFSEIGFVGENQISISPLVEFPRNQLDRGLYAWPEAGLIIAQTGKMFHIADTGTGCTKSMIPYLTWLYDEGSAVLLDAGEGIIAFNYLPMDIDDDSSPYIIYNYKNDTKVYETGEASDVIMILPITSDMVISKTYTTVQNKAHVEFYLYNWKTRGKAVNELTKKLTELNLALQMGPVYGILPDKQFLVTQTRDRERVIKISWDDNYGDIHITPLDHIKPEGKWILDLSFSSNGEWATTIAGGDTGLYGESLYKRLFYHIDDRYPGGISLPVFADSFEQSLWEGYGAFVEHPVYGWCYAQEYHKKDNNDKDELYLRLYKMSDVQNEIDRLLLEVASGAIKK
jgi:hypothetical protein